MKIVGISGGSGAGKSTVSYKLVDAYPDTFEILNFDDYQKVGEDPNLPMFDDMINWDHPDIIKWDTLITDIKKLSTGEDVTIQSWAHRSNSDYFKHKKKIPRTMHPKKILIVEGYMSLWNKDLRTLFDRSYYLDIDEVTSTARRDKFVDPLYDEKVLKPMHAQYVKPTKEFADIVLEVSDKSPEEVYNLLEQDLKENNLL